MQNSNRGRPAQAPLRVAVVGAGIAGLTAAYDLAQAGPAHVQVHVYEGSPTVGGLAAGFKGRSEWDWHLEQFYHHLFTSDDAIIDFTREIGCGDALQIYRPVTAIHTRGANYPLDSVLRVLSFPLIPLVDRVRMGMVIAYLRYHPRPPWRRFDRVLADSWLRRWMGSRAYEAAWQFQIEGKFGPHYREVNLAWFWARVYKRTPRLGYYRGGFQTFIDHLRRQVEARGVTVQTNAPVRAIQVRPEGGFDLSAGDQLPVHYDVVLSTVSPGLMRRLAPELPNSYLDQLQRLKSLGAVVVTLALDRRLMRDLYWISLAKDAGLPFLALVEHTNMIDPVHYAGDHLLYLGDYLDPDHRYFEMGLDELLAEFLPALTRFNPNFRPDWVTGAWVHKARYAQPVPPVGYAGMIPAVRTPLPGLYFASMSQVYPWDRGTNYAVEMGRNVARMIQGDRGLSAGE